MQHQTICKINEMKIYITSEIAQQCVMSQWQQRLYIQYTCRG